MANPETEKLGKYLEEQLVYTKSLQVSGSWQEAQNALTSFLEQIGGAEISALNQRGLINRMLKDYSQALDDFTRARNLAYEGGLQEAELTATNGLIDLYRTGDRDPNFTPGRNFHQAQIHETEAETLMAQMPPEWSLAKVQAYTGFGLLHDNMENPQRALESYKQAEDGCRNLLSLDPQNNDLQNRLALALTNKGVAMEKVGDLEGALLSQREALETYLQLGDLRGVGNAKISLGDVLNKQGGPEKARNLWQQALMGAQRGNQIIDPDIYNLAVSRLKQ